MSARMIRAPWTPEQVAALNRFQREGGMHPFTCGNLHASGQSPVLHATPAGWECPDPGCLYTQDWAHAFMLAQTDRHRFTVRPVDPELERAATERARQAAGDSARAAAWIAAHSGPATSGNASTLNEPGEKFTPEVKGPAGLRDRIDAAIGQVLDDDPMHTLTDLQHRLTTTVLAALLAAGVDRETRIPLDDLTSTDLDQLYDDLDRYTEIVGEMNDAAVQQAKELDEAAATIAQRTVEINRLTELAEQQKQRAARAEAAAATPRELELRQRHAWSTAGNCPMCGYDDCDGRLCDDCAATVRRLPSHDRRQWRRYQPVTESGPIQGHGYTPAGLLGIALDSTEPTP